MEIGFIGLGRMGANMVRRLLQGGHSENAGPPDGYLLCGPADSGHFVKMVHNGIEYGMLRACSKSQ
jgi:6-phosphogluconate dehydrogenase (decarboxylating)